MPLLDIATAQTSLQNHLGPIRAHSIVHCKVLSTPFIFGDEKRLVSVGKIFHFPKNVNLQHKSKFQIKAVATFEPKCLESKEDGQKSDKNAKLGTDLDPSAGQVGSSRRNWTDLDERERLRRTRISKANRGNTPWNKGRKHSAETLQRIRERTRIAMQDPKVRKKLANLGHSQSNETRKKIGVGVRIGWEKRRQKLMLQETCYFKWQNLIAEASRTGYEGEEELQWDSYKIISAKLDLEWAESVEQRKSMPRPKGSKRAPKSPEQRRKIAEAIAAKWADPEYRERVCSALSKYHGTPVGLGRKQRRTRTGGTQSTKRESVKKRPGDTGKSSINGSVMKQKSKAPSYKDPLASSKLEMIKNIRAQRAATETKKIEAVERARLLIAEAEKAAKALEVAAMKSPIARASLVETRKLIAEAIQSIEAIDTGFTMSDESDERSTLKPPEFVGQVDRETDIGNGGLDHSELREANGTSVLPTSNDDDLNLTNLTLHEILNGGQKELLPASSSGFGFSPFSLESLVEHSSSPNQFGQLEPNGNVKYEINPQPNGSEVQHIKEEMPSKSGATTKKWVRGRLVEVSEER